MATNRILLAKGPNGSNLDQLFDVENKSTGNNKLILKSTYDLSANLDIKTYVLLTLGCEWRWSHDKTTNWYPNVKLFRQKQLGDWSNVIKELVDE